MKTKEKEQILVREEKKYVGLKLAGLSAAQLGPDLTTPLRTASHWTMAGIVTALLSRAEERISKNVIMECNFYNTHTNLGLRNLKLNPNKLLLSMKEMELGLLLSQKQFLVLLPFALALAGAVLVPASYLFKKNLSFQTNSIIWIIYGLCVFLRSHI